MSTQERTERAKHAASRLHDFNDYVDGVLTELEKDVSSLTFDYNVACSDLETERRKLSQLYRVLCALSTAAIIAPEAITALIEEFFPETP